MTTHLLDTNIASHIIKGDIPSVRQRLVAVPIHSVAVSVITQAELLYGVAKHGHPPGLSTKVREFLRRVAVLPWTAEVGEAYGHLRAACEAEGASLAPMDMMIAAQAKALALQGQDVVLVTRDATFARPRALTGLTLEDWTKEPPLPG